MKNKKEFFYGLCKSLELMHDIKNIFPFLNEDERISLLASLLAEEEQRFIK